MCVSIYVFVCACLCAVQFVYVSADVVLVCRTDTCKVNVFGEKQP